MKPDSALVLLHDAASAPASWAATASMLRQRFRVLAPQLLLTPEVAGSADDPRPFTLQRAADSVGRAIEDAGYESAVVCGVGLGAMVGLTLAVQQPHKVHGLALVTAQTRLPPMLRSLPTVVISLLPAYAVARLVGGGSQVVALLDQVRPVDFRSLAAQVHAPCLVICAERDRVNLRASAALARAVPNAQFKILPGVEPGWLVESPHLLSQAVADFFG